MAVWLGGAATGEAGRAARITKRVAATAVIAENAAGQAQANRHACLSASTDARPAKYINRSRWS